jgi:hypothetical protein
VDSPGIHGPDRDGLLTLLAGRTTSLTVQEADIPCTSLLTSGHRKRTCNGTPLRQGCPKRETPTSPRSYKDHGLFQAICRVNLSIAMTKIRATSSTTRDFVQVAGQGQLASALAAP